MDQRIMVFDEDHMEEPLMSSSRESVDSFPAGSSWIQSPPQVVEAYEQLPLLGLKLSRTPSFLDRLEKLDQLLPKQNSTGQDQPNYNSGNYAAAARGKSKDTLQNASKLKAENCPISLLRVGSWQRVSRNEGDLVAKFYFAKRKLVWEILECGLKSKIEIQWSEILSFKAVLPEDQPGILHIELNQPPSFHHEIDPQPRKHTQWRMAADFTGGQALTIRRHYIEFPFGALDKSLEKLLRCDGRLYQLSRQGFPALDTPYFQPQTTTTGVGFSFDFGGQTSNVNPNRQQQFSILNVPTPTQYLSHQYQTYEQTAQNSLIDGVNKDSSGSPISDEHISNNYQVSLWGQGMNNVRGSLITNQVGGMAFSATPVAQECSTISIPSNHIHMQPSPILSIEEAERHLPSFQTLDDLQEFSNAVAWANLSGEGKQPISSAINITAIYGQDMVDNNDHVVMNNIWSSNVGPGCSSIYPQLVSGPQPQIPNENMSMNHLPAGNINTSYSSLVPDPSMGYFPSDNGINEVNNWTRKPGSSG